MLGLKLCAAAALCTAALTAGAQSSEPGGLPETSASGSAAHPTATIEFHYDNAKQLLAKYVVVVHDDGSGHFHSSTGDAKPDDIAALPEQGQDRDIRISAGIAERMFAIARAKKFFAMACDSGSATVAFQGKKLLVYNGSDGKGACTYNYSKDAQIEWLTDEFEGIASTLDEGRKLATEHEHGRLSLDAELETLETMVHNGQAVELTNIAPTLRDIAGDDAVLQRAQKRARQLLFEADRADAEDKLKH